MSEYPSLAQIKAIIFSTRLPVTTEAKMQEAILARLERAGVRYGREVKLGTGPGGDCGRIDFTVRADVGLIGIECKTQGSAMDHARQLIRYGMSGQLTALVLLSSRPVSLPIRSVNYTTGTGPVEIPVHQCNPPTL